MSPTFANIMLYYIMAYFLILITFKQYLNKESKKENEEKENEGKIKGGIRKKTIFCWFKRKKKEILVFSFKIFSF